MHWIFFYAAAMALILGTIGYLLYRYFCKHVKGRRISALHILFGSCFAAVLLLCIPPTFAQYGSQKYGVLQTVVFSFQRAIRVFGADDIHDVVLDNLLTAPEKLQGWYARAVLFLQLAAPLLTFGFVASFFKNLISAARYRLYIGTEAHIFSSLNQKSIALADSIIRKQTAGKKWTVRPLIVFTDVIYESEEEYYDLLEEARILGAVIFRKDLESVQFDGHFIKRKLYFYLMGEDNQENSRHAAAILERYDRPGTAMYVFTDNQACAMLLSAMDNRHMQIYRINSIQFLIYHNLTQYGARLFQNARMYNNNVISAVIVGLGRYGLEMLKALLWYCQMPGFTLKVHVFDEDEKVCEKFTAMCPGIMEMNGSDKPGETRYHITFHGGMEVSSETFAGELEAVKDATYIFVGLGEDDANINASVQIRSLYEWINPAYKPDIETIVYDTERSQTMGAAWQKYIDGVQEEKPGGILNFKKQAYRIHTIGDMASLYSVDTVIDSNLVQAGMDVHKRWVDCSDAGKVAKSEKEFWQYEYYYRSSVTKAMHESLRRELTQLGYICIPGTDKDWHALTQEEKLAIGLVEHIRWNAYMRTEGYRYAAVRNDLAKRHNLLVSVYRLDDDTLRMDA